jgi:hypothetical protein
MPKVSNRRAAERIAAGDYRWDKRHVERVAYRRRIARQADAHHHLTRLQRRAMLAVMPSWVRERSAFRTATVGEQELGELREGLRVVADQDVDVPVAGLSAAQRRQLNLGRVRGPLVFDA